MGMPKKPFYRIVACKRKAPRDGKHLEILGTYNPIPDFNGNKQVTLKVDSIKKWIMHGAEPSERVAKILANGAILPPVPRRSLLLDQALLMEPPAAAEEDAEGDDDGDASSDADTDAEGAGVEGDASEGSGEEPRT